jgi:hypothetical protein
VDDAPPNLPGKRERKKRNPFAQKQMDFFFQGNSNLKYPIRKKEGIALLFTFYISYS